MGELDQASRYAQHAYEVLRENKDDDRSAGKALMVLSWVARERKDWESAVRHSKEAIAHMARLHGTDNLELAFTRRELGLALGQLERYDEAIEQLSQCAAVFLRVGPTHPDTLEVALEVGELYERAGRYADAERNDRKAVELARGPGKAAPGRLGGALLELARMVAHRSPAEAVPIYDEGMRLVVKERDIAVDQHVEALQEISKVALAAGRARWMLTWFDRLPRAAAKLPALRRKLIKAARRRR